MKQLTPIKKLIFTIVTFITSLCSHAQVIDTEFVIGVVPNLSARIVANNYQPFAEYFQNSLGIPVSIVTAKDFSTFHQRAMAKSFQIMVTTPNLGRVAAIDGGWEVLYVFEPSIPGLLVGLKSQNNDLTKLQEKKIAIANPQSLVALAGINWLREQGYTLGKDYSVLNIANDDSLGVALTSGEAPFAMMSMGEFKAKDPELQSSLKIINEFVRLPNFFVMVSPTMSIENKTKIKFLLSQMSGTPLGVEFYKRTGFTSMKNPTDEQNKFLDKFVEITKKALVPKN